MAVEKLIAKYKLVFLGDQGCGKTSIINKFMYDKFYTTYQSFLNTENWIDEVRGKRGLDAIIVLVGNKTDLQRQVSTKEGDAKARDFDVIFVETSTKIGFNVKPLFRKIVDALRELETPSPTKQEHMAEANEKSSSNTSQSDDQLINDSVVLLPVEPPLTKFIVVLLGDQNVGKTSILTRFMCERFDTSYQATDGIDFMSKTLYLEDRTVRLQLWDTGGRDEFRSLIPNFLKDSSVAMVVYDVADLRSFLNTAKWIEEVRRERGRFVIIVLVGNKTDLVEKRQVSFEDGEAKAQELDVMFIETSAKSGFNTKTLFMKTAAALPKLETLSSSNKKPLLM